MHVKLSIVGVLVVCDLDGNGSPRGLVLGPWAVTVDCTAVTWLTPAVYVGWQHVGHLGTCKRILLMECVY